MICCNHSNCSPRAHNFVKNLELVCPNRWC